jgi:hypothetical protein
MGDVHGEICLAWAWCWFVLVLMLVMRGDVDGGVIGDWIGFVQRMLSMRSNVPEYLGRSSILAQSCSLLRAISKYIDTSILSYLDSSCSS